MMDHPSKVIAAVLLAFSLGACSHSGHEAMMGTHGQNMGCPMMQQSAGGSHADQMGEKDNSRMMAMGCPMMGGMNKPAPKSDAKPPAADDHAQHHPN